MKKTVNNYPEKIQQMLDSIKLFCKEMLNREYYDLCILLLDELYYEERFNLEKGDSNVWCASIIHSIGTINFVFDKNFKPNIKLDDLCAFFKTNTSTIYSKEKEIRKLLNIHYLNPFYSIQRVTDNSPLKDLVILDNELVSLLSFPVKIQKAIKLERECYSDVVLKRDKKNPHLIIMSPVATEPYTTYKKFVNLEAFKNNSFNSFCMTVSFSLLANKLSKENKNIYKEN